MVMTKPSWQLFVEIQTSVQKTLSSFVTKMKNHDAFERMLLTAERTNSTSFSNEEVYSFPEEMWQYPGSGAALTSLDKTMHYLDSRASPRSLLH